MNSFLRATFVACMCVVWPINAASPTNSPDVLTLEQAVELAERQHPDLAEARAIGSIFGRYASRLPCISSKPVTGHCLGATPAMEAVLAIETLGRQIVPPTANCEELDPECAINLVREAALPTRLDHVMSNSLGFWGYHASLIFSKPNA